jgi:hypothetical protein
MTCAFPAVTSVGFGPDPHDRLHGIRPVAVLMPNLPFALSDIGR